MFSFFQEIYDKLPIAQKITFLVTAMRNSDNAIEVRNYVLHADFFIRKKNNNKIITLYSDVKIRH